MRERSGSIEKAFCFAGDNEFFIRWDHHYFHARVGSADDGFSGAGCLIARRIENDPKLIEVSADGFAEFGTVFTDTGRKDDGGRTIQLEEITAHPLPRAGHEHIDRELGSDVTLSCGILN